jgi:Cdc6-like AAA superfamily ATPase
MVKYNPFRPGSVISPGMFTGRSEEIRSIEQSLLQTKNANPQHFLIEGERGIGKSSLCLYLDYVARGEINFEDKKLNFIVVYVELREAMSYDDIVDEIIAELKRQIAERQALLETCKKAWEFLSRFQVGGVKYDASRPVDTGPRLNELTDLLVDLVSDAGNAIDGVLLLVDEADNPPGTSHLGQLCKLLTERLSRRNCEKICFGLSGLPGLISRLKESHESSPRIFRVLTLEPLENSECEIVIERGLDDAEIIA